MRPGGPCASPAVRLPPPRYAPAFISPTRRARRRMSAPQPHPLPCTPAHVATPSSPSPARPLCLPSAHTRRTPSRSSSPRPPPPSSRGCSRHLLPAFKRDSGIDARVVAVGTGQALDMGRRGDADVVFVHDQVAEDKFVAEGFGVKRFPVMYNDFVLVGPKSDPAGVKGKDIQGALAKLGASTQPSSRAATRAARMRPSCATGRRPTSTWRPPSRPATRSAAAAWARR